ncbi:MAG: hypothetical protein AMXMBFR72_07220 [Betaproteobacteria bacterium]|jgi:hypothetical protein
MKGGAPSSTAKRAVRDEPLARPELIHIIVPLLALGPALLMILVFWAVL